MIKSLFENLTLVQKVQLYLLVPMLFWLLFFGIETVFSQPRVGIISPKSNFITIEKNKLETTTSSKIVRFIENKIELYKVTLHNIDIKKRLISIRVSGKAKDILSFLQKMQIHLDLISFELLQEKEDLVFHLVVDSEYFFNKELLSKEFFSHTKAQKIKKPHIKLEAIVDNEVLINDIWYKKGASYKSYQIINIEKNFITLKDTQSQKSFKVDLLNESL